MYFLDANILFEVLFNRKKADEAHKKLKEIFDNDKEDINKFKALSKKIYETRKEQQDAFDKFINFKNKFLEVNNKLKERLTKLNELNKQVDEIKGNIRKEKEMIKQKKMDEQDKEMEDKLLKKKKLTKDDLIMLQR